MPTRQQMLDARDTGRQAAFQTQPTTACPHTDVALIMEWLAGLNEGRNQIKHFQPASDHPLEPTA